MIHIEADNPHYPRTLSTYLGEDAPPQLTIWGKFEQWPSQTLALFSSSKAPPSSLLAIHDLAQKWRVQGPTILSSFQSPIEEEALTVLLRGPQSFMIWLARGMIQRPPVAWRAALDEGRLLLVAPFADNVRRATAETAFVRNRIVAAMADGVLFAHAQPGSKTEQLARELRCWGKPIYTLPHTQNENLLALSAQTMVLGFVQ